MEVKQIYTLMNSVTGEVLGKSDIVKEDLSNVVDVGTEIFGSSSVDNYVKSLVNHIGKVIFVNRPYAGTAPSVLMDGWRIRNFPPRCARVLPATWPGNTLTRINCWPCWTTPGTSAARSGRPTPS